MLVLIVVFLSVHNLPPPLLLGPSFQVCFVSVASSLVPHLESFMVFANLCFWSGCCGVQNPVHSPAFLFATLQHFPDVEDVKFVINYDYPNSSEDYIHRIGRTARSQKTGTAYTFFTPNNMRQANDLISVLREANQAINPKLLQMAEDRGGECMPRTKPVVMAQIVIAEDPHSGTDLRSVFLASVLSCLCVVLLPAGRSRGGRGGYKDDRRDRYSGGRRDFGNYRDRDNDRGYGSGPKTQNGGYGGPNSYDKGGSNSSNYSNGYGNNGQANSYGGAGNPVAPFQNQNFQAQPFGGNQAAGQNGMAHPPFPFTPQAPPQQPPQPMVPYPMPPAFPQ